MLTVTMNKLAAAPRDHQDYIKSVKPRFCDVKPDIPRMRPSANPHHQHQQQQQNIMLGDIVPLPGKKRTFPGLRSPITLYIAGKLSEDELKKTYKSSEQQQFELVRPSMTINRKAYSVPPNTPLNISMEKMFDGIIDHHMEVEIADYDGSIDGQSTSDEEPSSSNEYENQETEDALTSSGTDEDSTNVEDNNVTDDGIDYKALIQEEMLRVAREAGDGSTASSEDEPSNQATGQDPNEEFLNLQSSVFNMDAVMKVLNGDDGADADGADEVDIDELFNRNADEADADEFHEIVEANDKEQNN